MIRVEDFLGKYKPGTVFKWFIIVVIFVFVLMVFGFVYRQEYRKISSHYEENLERYRIMGCATHDAQTPESRRFCESVEPIVGEFVFATAFINTLKRVWICNTIHCSEYLAPFFRGTFNMIISAAIFAIGAMVIYYLLFGRSQTPSYPPPYPYPQQMQQHPQIAETPRQPQQVFVLDMTGKGDMGQNLRLRQLTPGESHGALNENV